MELTQQSNPVASFSMAKLSVGNGETLCPVTLARAKTLLEPRFFPLSHKGLDKLKISVYTPNYERTLASTKRSSIG